MRAVAFRRYGGPEVLEVLELPEPEPVPGQVRIRVAAATVNPADTLFRAGGLARGIEGPPPWVAGLELAGTVESVADGSGYRPGDRVAAMTRFLPHGRGAQSELVVLDAESSLARVPEGLDLVEAATVPMTGLTVRLLLDTLALPRGATLAVTGAAGAVGGFAVELGAAEGLRVIAISSEADEALARELGADAFVARGDDAFAEVRALAEFEIGRVQQALLLLVVELRRLDGDAGTDQAVGHGRPHRCLCHAATPSRAADRWRHPSFSDAALARASLLGRFSSSLPLNVYHCAMNDCSPW